MDNNIDNNLNTDFNQKVNKKKKYLIPLFIVLLIVCVAAIGLFLTSDSSNSNRSKKTNTANNSNKKEDQKVQVDDKNEENDKEDDDIDVVLGYSILSYSQDDGSGKSYYKIVELHKKEENKDIVSYEGFTHNAIGKVNKIDVYKASIVDNKLYYQLHFNSDEYDINTYSSFMCIDLSVDNPVPVEILSTKDFSNEKRRIVTYKVYGDYLYYLTLESKDSYYKYNMTEKKEEMSSEEEFESIKLFSDSNYEHIIGSDDKKRYFKGKSLYVNDNNKIIYDGEIIYTAQGSNIALYYPMDDNIIFSETQKCDGNGCSPFKYYKLNIETHEKEEIDYFTNKIYSQVTWYKK